MPARVGISAYLEAQLVLLQQPLRVDQATLSGLQLPLLHLHVYIRSRGGEGRGTVLAGGKGQCGHM